MINEQGKGRRLSQKRTANVCNSSIKHQHACLVKGKGKVVPVLLTEHHAMKECCGSEGIAPLIL
jgi:hypothetical protein